MREPALTLVISLLSQIMLPHPISLSLAQPSTLMAVEQANESLPMCMVFILSQHCCNDNGANICTVFFFNFKQTLHKFLLKLKN